MYLPPFIGMSEDIDQPSLIEESAEGSFARNYTMYGLLIVVILCIIWLWNILFIGLFLFFILGLYFAAEFNLHKTMHSILSKESVVIPRTTYLLYSLSSFLLAVICFLIYNDTIKHPQVTGSPLSFTYIYQKSLLITITFSLSFLGLRFFLLSLHLMDFIKFQCGLFGLLYRFLFVVRTLIVTGPWIKYFAEDENITFLAVLSNNRITLPGVYVAVKALFVAILIWDLETSRCRYKAAYKKSFIKTKGVCEICMNQCDFELHCKHKFCSSCRRTKLSKYPFCPICGKEVHSTVRFAYTDGYSSVASIFCCV